MRSSDHIPTKSIMNMETKVKLKLKSNRSFSLKTLLIAPALLILPVILTALTAGIIAGAQAQDTPPDPDLRRQDVPHGSVTNFTWKTSHVYPGTEHNCTVYVPAQYDASKPACVMLFQDGLGFNAPTVFDNLIAKKQMPVTIAIGISPGVSQPAINNAAGNANKALPRYNRSIEYDTPDDTYARFLIEEILPEVGKKYNLSSDPNDRGLCGGSSGGIAAFTAAWERPDQFRRVYSVIGSFTDLCGGDTYPSKIRKYEPRPLRIFLQDNDNDQDIYSGSWPLANQEVAAALKYAGYDTQFVVGKGGHDGGPGSRIFPEVMRWLWRDYPAPIKAMTSGRQSVTQFIVPNETWQPVASIAAVCLASDAAGNVLFTDRDHTIGRLDAEDKETILHKSAKPIYALAASLNGSPIASTDNGLVTYGPNGKETFLAKGVLATGLTINHEGMIYFADSRSGSLWQMTRNGQQRRMAENIRGGQTIALTPDQSLLITGGGGPRKTLLSWRVQADGALTDAEPFFDLTIPYNQTTTGATALTNDVQGWLYVATPAGIQICDQAGRVNGILELPTRTSPTGMAWGGPDHDTLYLACGGKLYKRKLRIKGVLPLDAPLTPPGPRL